MAYIAGMKKTLKKSEKKHVKLVYILRFMYNKKERS